MEYFAQLAYSDLPSSEEAMLQIKEEMLTALRVVKQSTMFGFNALAAYLYDANYLAIQCLYEVFGVLAIHKLTELMRIRKYITFAAVLQDASIKNRFVTKEAIISYLQSIKYRDYLDCIIQNQDTKQQFDYLLAHLQDADKILTKQGFPVASDLPNDDTIKAGLEMLEQIGEANTEWYLLVYQYYQKYLHQDRSRVENAMICFYLRFSHLWDGGVDSLLQIDHPKYVELRQELSSTYQNPKKYWEAYLVKMFPKLNHKFFTENAICILYRTRS